MISSQAASKEGYIRKQGGIIKVTCLLMYVIAVIYIVMEDKMVCSKRL